MMRLPAELLRDRLLALFRSPVQEPLADDEFNRLALDAFGFQFEHNAPYGAYCRSRGVTPDTLEYWGDVPPVPTAAFKYVDLVAGDAAAAEAVFRTSGTTHGRERRGTHYVLDLSLYHASLLAGFAAYVLPDDVRPTILSLLPPAAQLPDSSLAHMATVVVQELGDPHSGSFASEQHGIDEQALERALQQARADRRRVCLLGTSFSFVHWLASLATRGKRLELRDGSRLMDTGGYKGRDRTVSAEAMLAQYRDRLGLQPEWCVNEYGMTELCSQYYDAELRDRHTGAAGALRKAGPPWLRSRVVDAETLRPVPDGTPGLLQHFDLANLFSVMAVQTEDIAVAVPGGFQLRGRITDAPPRGCSIAMDDLLRAAGATGA